MKRVEDPRFLDKELLVKLTVCLNSINKVFDMELDTDLENEAIRDFTEILLPLLPSYVVAVNLVGEETATRASEEVEKIQENFRQEWSLDRVVAYCNSIRSSLR